MIRRAMMFILVVTAVSCRPAHDDSDAPVQNNSQRPETGEQSSQDSGETAAKGNGDWTEEYEKMASALELSDDETDKLKRAFEAREQEVSDWMSDKGARLSQLERQMTEAAKARDLAGVRRITTEAGPLRNELRELFRAHDESIRGVLTVENQVAWEAHVLAEKLLDLMGSLKLTEEQIKEIHAQAMSAMQAAAGFPNPKASAFLKLEQGVESSVLSQEQRKIYDGEKKKHPLRSLN